MKLSAVIQLYKRDNIFRFEEITDQFNAMMFISLLCYSYHWFIRCVRMSIVRFDSFCRRTATSAATTTNTIDWLFSIFFFHYFTFWVCACVCLCTRVECHWLFAFDNTMQIVCRPDPFHNCAPSLISSRLMLVRIKWNDVIRMCPLFPNFFFFFYKTIYWYVFEPQQIKIE